MTNTREQRTVDWYTNRFQREYNDARTEYLRLAELFKDACWYNFEVTCRDWRAPWRRSDLSSLVELLGMSFHRKWCRGCLMEHGHFPVWFSGSITEAPPLPPQIILAELKQAKEYMDACETQVTAAHDWAPGGPLYTQLARQTLVGRSCVPTTTCVYVPPEKRRRFSSC